MNWLNYFLYYTIIILVIYLLNIFFRARKKRLAISEEPFSNILTENRLRSGGKPGHQSLAKYSLSEIYAVQNELRDIAYKRLMKQKLLDSDKNLVSRFPVSAKLIYRQVKRQRAK